jgi:uncharacterized protein (DUF305 family)
MEKMDFGTNLKCTILGIAFLVASPGSAQEETPALPSICTANAGHMMAPADMGGEKMGGAHMGGADQAHEDLAKGMAETNALMMQGMTATDIDVAFVCGMIPHHQAAINMAKAELAHGDDPWVKELAQAVIDAQQREIDEMLAWLAKQPG